MQPGEWWYQQYEGATHTKKGKQKTAGHWTTPLVTDPEEYGSYARPRDGERQNVRVSYRVDTARSEFVIAVEPLDVDEALALLKRRKGQYQRAKKEGDIPHEPENENTGEPIENEILGGIIT